jgi:hypothetical protein
MKKTIIAILSISLLSCTTSANAATKPLNNKENKNSCSFIKTKYKTTATASWSNGVGTDQDIIKEIQDNIEMLTKKSLTSNGEIKKQIKLWIDAEKDTELSISNANGEVLISSMNKKISIVTKFNKLCKSIGK